jgi:hypothetical protein
MQKLSLKMGLQLLQNKITESQLKKIFPSPSCQTDNEVNRYNVLLISTEGSIFLKLKYSLAFNTEHKTLHALLAAISAIARLCRSDVCGNNGTLAIQSAGNL